MKLKSLFIKTIAIGAVASLAVNCHAKKVEDNPLLFFALSNTITGLAQGNCAISVNLTGLYWQTLVQVAVRGAADAAAGNTFRTHFNALNNTNLTNAQLQDEPYNIKFDAYFTDTATWTEATRSTHLQAVLTAVGGGAPFTTLTNVRGNGLLACARIPKANCSIGGATTGSIAGDLASAKNAYDAVYENADCKKSDSLLATLRTNLFKGAPSTQVNLSSGPFTNPYYNADNYAVTSSTSILPVKGYPKFGSLVSLGFGVLMPVKTGTTAYALTGGTSYTAGSNIAFTPVASCESIGMGDKGFTVATGTTPLTPVQEVAYSLSTNGTAASAYNTARGLASGAYVASAAGEDAKNCNNSFRAKSPISLLLGGGKLGDVNGGAGDGGVSALLTTCVYGGSTRATTKAFLPAASAILTGINDCPSAAASAAAKFGDTGLINLANFPND
jgi:hypothetical protein